MKRIRGFSSGKRWGAVSAAICLAGAGCLAPLDEDGASTGPVDETSSALSGENLAGSNLAGANLAGSNLAGTNLAGANLGGSNLAGSNLAGSNLGGTNLAGNNLAGSNLAGSNLAGSNLAGSNLAGSNLAGNNLAGSNLSATNLAGSTSGFNIHNLPHGSTGMLYSGEDVWGKMTERCVVMGLGSTAFAKLLGQQSANATMYVALGKLPWGFANTSGASASLKAWEAVIWGDKTYCSFVLVAPPDATWAGVAGFVKAVFRWQAPPSQTLKISGIEASAPHDTTLNTSTLTYTGMMNAAGQWKAGKVSDKNFVAGEVAFVSATTNNQSVTVDFASWVMDSTSTGLILGNVQSSNPPTRAESVYYAVDNGDGTVSVKIAAAASGLTSVSDTFEALNASWSSFQDTAAAKPVPRRCGGALYLNYYYGEPVPSGKCDSGLTWGNASSATGSRKWSSVAGTTAPMNQYMLLPLNASTPLMRGANADDLKVVLSETYVHTWDAASDAATGLTVVDDNVIGTGLNKWNYVGDDATYWKHAIDSYETYRGTNSYENAAGKYATFTFQGTMIQLYFAQEEYHGISAVSLDGGPETMVDLYSKNRRGFQLLWAASNLTPGVNHTVKVRVTGNKNHKAIGTNTSIDAAVVSNAACVYEPDSSFCTRLGKNCGSVTGIDNCGASRTVAFCGSCASPQTCGGSGEDNVCGNGEVVDDQIKGVNNNQFEYVGTGWTSCYRCGNGSLYNSSKSECKTSGGYARFRFNGVKIKLYGTKAPNHGIGAVSIDGGPETNVDFYNSTVLGDQLVWTSPLLSSGAHTLKLRITGSRNASATDTFIVPDRVAVSASATCSVESNSAFCARLAKNCGSVTGTDNCGSARTVSSCGSCSSGQNCGSGVCSSSASNLFTNPSFTGGTTGWVTWFAPGCSGSFAGSSTSQDGDGKGAKVTIGSYSGPLWDKLQILQIKTTNGSPYTLTAQFQKTEGSSKSATVFCSENGGAYAIYGSTVCNNTSGWTSCSVTCTPPPGRSVKFGIALGASDVDAVIDNMSLTQ